MTASDAKHITERLRDVADAIEEDHAVVPDVLLLARTAIGEIISEDSGLTCVEACRLAADFTTDVRDRLQRFPRFAFSRRCSGRSHR